MEKKYYLRLYDVEFEVSKEVYYAYYREKRRNKYLIEADRANELVYYQAFDTDEYSGTEAIADKSAGIEDVVENQMMVDKLKECFKFLSETEMSLIDEIFFKGKSERGLSAETGVPQKTINNRKKRILEKLKHFLEN